MIKKREITPLMIKILYGPKGFGKTKILLDEVNKNAREIRESNTKYLSLLH